MYVSSPRTTLELRKMEQGERTSAEAKEYVEHFKSLHKEFQVGDLGTYNKLRMKKFGPYEILKNHDLGNAYEVEFLDGIRISPIFNIADLIEYHDDGMDEGLMLEPCPIPTSKKEEIEEILDSCVGKSTKNRQYEEYLVNWKGRPIEDSNWISTMKVAHLGFPLP